MPALDWDDLRYVLAVSNEGSLAGAARQLGVNHTTVLRRVAAFEKRLGLRLFERLPNGYALTPGGEELLATARRIDEAVATLERRLAGQDLRLSGTVRVTTTDTLMASVLPEILAQFRRAHPGILIEVAVSNLLFNLTRRDADVAIRPADDPPEALIGRRVAGVAFAIYAGRDYRMEDEAFEDPALEHWIGPDDTLAGTAAARWMRKRVPDTSIGFRADSLVALRQAAAAGLGLAMLPCYLGDTAPDLRRVQPPLADARTALWVLTHEDLRRTARIRAFTDFMAAALVERRSLFEAVAD